jgi:hypothetical protein
MFMRKAYLKFVKTNYPPIEPGNDAYATHENRVRHLAKELQQNFSTLGLIERAAGNIVEPIDGYRDLLDYWMAFFGKYVEDFPKK